MKKISLALMTILAAAAFTCCSPEPTENTKDNSSETEQPAGEDTTDPGTTDPGTTDPGTTDPGTTDPVEEPKLAVNLTLSVVETGYASIKFSGNTEVKNQKDEIVRTEFYWIASDGTVPAAKDLVENGTQCKFYSYSPTEEASSHSEEFALKLLAEEHVSVAPGGTFGETSKQMIRISYGTDMEPLCEGIRRLCRFIRKYT